MAADRPYGEFYDFYSVSPEYFGYNFQTTTVHKEREQLGDRRNAGESSCNSGDGTGQMAHPLMFMMMMMMNFVVYFMNSAQNS
jgi:hypothetical protein